MDPRKDGSRSVSPHRGYHPPGPRHTMASMSNQPGQVPGSLNILSTILRSPHPSLQASHARVISETGHVTGRGQSPIRVITTLPPSVSSSISPRTGLSPSRTPTTLPPKKSLSPSRSVYTERQSPSPKNVRSTELINIAGMSGGQTSIHSQVQGRQTQGQLLSHLPFLAQTLQCGKHVAHEDLFQQYKSQQLAQGVGGPTSGNLLKETAQSVVVGQRSPGRQTQPLPAHQRIPSPQHVIAKRRTPSPAHMPVGADPTAKVIVAHTGSARPQAVNLVKTSAHQTVSETRLLDADFKYGDLLQSINKSSNIQSHLLQGGLSPITPADPVASKSWPTQPAPQLVPVPSVALSLGHALSSAAFSQTHNVQPAIRNTGTIGATHMSVSQAVGFTPVVLPSQSYRSRSPGNFMGIPVSSSSAISNNPASVHQSGVSYIHTMGTPAQSVSMTEPGPPNITISSCSTIPTPDRPHQKLPRNPFTFPATPPITLTNERPIVGHGIPIIQSKVKTESKLTLSANEKQRHSSDEMPQLSPVKKVEIKKEEEENLVSIPNAYNMRMQTLANFPNNPTYRPTYRATSVAIHKAKVGCVVNSAKSLDILRQTLQKSMNKEIDAIIKSYLDKFFKIGIENIKLNNGESSVNDDHIQAVCRQILEEAKKMYLSDTGRQSVSPARELSDNVSEAGSSGRRSALGRRRHPSDTDSEASLRPTGNTKKKKGRYIVNLTGRSTPSKLALQQSKREGPKFEPERLTEETMFVMGSKANKAMGFGATRGRLYMKHPELFKYGGDQDDKTWLYEHQHMPATGGKSYLIVLDDVRELALNDEYRDATGITVEQLSGFTVPMWMIEKMRIQMVAMRTDLPKQAKYRSRSATPNEASFVPVEVNDEETPKEIKDLPFSSFSSPKQSSSFMEASATDKDLEFLSNTGNSNTPSQMSPFNMTGGFDDTASQSDLDTLDDDSFSLVK
ncbi:uncharacterized protein LOC132729346 isoform X2 [Ruditapes philippinarum]|uniref:uncharacterized protein LOC132729346 isoform X2 n=1 Tax=Ruditapes philippinarum TaxID=129788 RepID=UPI00295AE24B|nr:uncharacterized protein LOC132729346 isoform X2 [Ruditapes philippinarum]